MLTIVESIKKIVEDEIRKLHLCEVGEITSVFPHSIKSDKNNYECNVRLKDKGVELRKVPVATSHIGLAHIPHTGDLVLLSFINGDINAPIITGRLYNDEDRPPLSKSEEIIYIPPYAKNNDLRRLNIVLPGGTVSLVIHDDHLTIVAGKSMMNINSAGELTLKSVKKAGKSSSSESSEGIVITARPEEGSLITMDNNQINYNVNGGGFASDILFQPGKMKFVSNGGGEISIEHNKKCKIILKDDSLNINSDVPITISGKERITLEADMIVLDAKNISIAASEEIRTHSEGMTYIMGTPVKIN